MEDNNPSEDQENTYRSSSSSSQQQPTTASEAKEHQKRYHNSNNNNHSVDNEEECGDDDKDHDSKGGNNSSYRLLGDLPSLSGNNQRGGQPMNYREREMIDKDVKVALNLELPQQQGRTVGLKEMCCHLSYTVLHILISPLTHLFHTLPQQQGSTVRDVLSVVLILDI